MLNLITKIAIYDPDASDHVTLTNIMEGVDGSASFAFQQEAESVMIEDGQTLDHTLNGTLDIKVLRASAADLAIIDAAVGKRVYIAGMTLDGFLLFSGMHYMNRVPDFNSSILNDHIRFTFSNAKGYTGPVLDGPSYGGRNALMLSDVVNAYTDGNDNDSFGGFFAFTSSASYEFSGGQITMTSTPAGTGGLRTAQTNYIFWPFREIITFSCDYVSGDGGIRLVINANEENFGEGGSSAGVVLTTPSTTVGRLSLSTDTGVTENANEPRFYNLQLEFNGESTEVTAVIKDLALRRGTADTFTY